MGIEYREYPLKYESLLGYLAIPKCLAFYRDLSIQSRGFLIFLLVCSALIEVRLDLSQHDQKSGIHIQDHQKVGFHFLQLSMESLISVIMLLLI